MISKCRILAPIKLLTRQTQTKKRTDKTEAEGRKQGQMKMVDLALAEKFDVVTSRTPAPSKVEDQGSKKELQC